MGELQAAAEALGLRIRMFSASSIHDIDAAFQVIPSEHVTALVVTADPFFDTRRDQIAALAASHAIAVISQFRDQAIAGGLMSYGIDLPVSLESTPEESLKVQGPTIFPCSSRQNSSWSSTSRLRRRLD
jgi:hypothetical protein